MKRKNKKTAALIVAAALAFTSVFSMPLCAQAKKKSIKTKYYTISKRAGTYSSAIRVKVKARKGYRVYYKTSGKFKKAKVIRSGKSKTFKISKTTTLSLCAVKKTAKVTNRKLNKSFKKKKSVQYANYKYTIKKAASSKAAATTDTASASPTASSEVTASPTATASSEVTVSPTATASSKETASPTATASSEPTASPAVTASPTKTPAVIEDDTQSVTLSVNGISTENLEDDAVTLEESGNYNLLAIHQAGTYVLSGGSTSDPVTNTVMAVDESVTGEVSLIWDNLVIDNSALGTTEGEDLPVFSAGGEDADIHITLKGSSSITGNGAYTESPAAALICVDDASATLTFSAYEGEADASLTVYDAMDSSTDFGSNDPSDGIYCKGTLALESGTYQIHSNGDCLKGTGKKGAGGITVYDGQYTLYSAGGGGLKSKNGMITIYDGEIETEYTAEDGIQAKNYGVTIYGGTVTIDQCYGDGIQAETVSISGDDTAISITTYFENAGINYYNSALGTGNYNTLTSSDTVKKEVVCVDTGSHKGIKAGTKAHTYSYDSVEEDSEYTAGETYSTEASGGIEISGGTITIDTTNTGIKYNGGGSSMGGHTGSSSSGGNLSAANSDGQYIIGAPDDGIHSNNTCVISGATIKIASADDGITGPAGVSIVNGADITISKCYEGIEGGEIVIGSSEQTSKDPSIKIYSDDDGVNAASKSSVVYEYEDETEEKYTKTETASSDNTLKVLSGYLNVMIGDDTSHSFSLAVADGDATTGSYTSDGDGIDCNGSFYAYGGTIIVFGANSNDNSPVDTDGTYYIGSGVTLLAVGSSGMVESPTELEQAAVTYGGSNGGMNIRMAGPGGAGQGGQSSTSSLSANTAFAIMQDTEVLLAMKPIKNYNYILYTSPELEENTAYTLYSGGSVSGSLVQSDSDAWDYRYTGFDTSGATVLSTVTAQK